MSVDIDVPNQSINIPSFSTIAIPDNQKCSRCDEKNRTLVPIAVFEENKDTDVWFLCPHCFRTRFLGRS